MNSSVTGQNERILALTEIAAEIHNTAIEKGWWEERLNAINKLGVYGQGLVEAQMLMLTVTELSEGLEGLRKDLPDDHLPEFKMIECELADAIIRIFDHGEAFGYRVAEAMLAKMEYNKNRSHKHGGKSF